jgi:hypothetical protein
MPASPFDPASSFDALDEVDTVELPNKATAVDESATFSAAHFDPIDHGGDWLSATLPVTAIEAFDRFADLEALPSWLPVIGSVHVHRRDGLDRPTWVSFTAQVERGAVGYSLHYDYQPEILGVRWATPPGANLQVSGWVRFSSLGRAACLMEYQLWVDSGALPAWRDPFYAQHAPSAVIHHFREHLRRTGDGD